MNRLSSSAPSPRPTAFRKTSSPSVVSSGPNSSAATTTAIVSRLRRRMNPPALTASPQALDPWNQFLDVHRRLLSVVDPCRHPWRRSCAMGLTSDALRPRSDAGRGRRSGDEEDAARPGSTHGNRLRRAAATRGLKKTQPGPESTQRNGLRGSCCYLGDEEDAARPRVNSEELGHGLRGRAAMKWGRTDRPADQPQDGPVRDATRPGSYVGNILGCCAREAASQLRPHRRPARGEAAASSTGTMPQT